MGPDHPVMTCILHPHWFLVTVSVCKVFTICQLFLQKQNKRRLDSRLMFFLRICSKVQPNRESLYLHSTQVYTEELVYLSNRRMKTERRSFFIAGIHWAGNELTLLDEVDLRAPFCWKWNKLCYWIIRISCSQIRSACSYTTRESRDRTVWGCTICSQLTRQITEANDPHDKVQLQQRQDHTFVQSDI